MKNTQQQIESTLAGYIDPYTGSDLASSGAIENISLTDGKAELVIKLGYPAGRHHGTLISELEAALLALQGVEDVRISIKTEITPHAVQGQLKPLPGVSNIIAVATKHEIVLAIVGGLFVLETLSVIIQVASYKLTGKRVFRMAPLHHHFEQKGWAEATVVVRFWIISVVLALIGLATLKLR